MIVLYILAALAVLALVLNFIDLTRLVVRSYEVSSNKAIPELTIVHLSDLHNTRYGKDNERLLRKIREAKPDMILITGDMINGKVKENRERVLHFLARLTEFCPVYYSNGNHECRLGRRNPALQKEYEEALLAMGIRLLRNETAVFSFTDASNTGFDGEKTTGIQIDGLELSRPYFERKRKPTITREALNTFLPDPNPEVFSILLAHNPDYFPTYSQAGYDLVLSGHVHGGLVRLPLLGGVVSPRVSFFPKYDGGRFEENGSTMILSRGVGFHSIPVRLFNPCEVVKIHIRPEA